MGAVGPRAAGIRGVPHTPKRARASRDNFLNFKRSGLGRQDGTLSVFLWHGLPAREGVLTHSRGVLMCETVVKNSGQACLA